LIRDRNRQRLTQSLPGRVCPSEQTSSKSETFFVSEFISLAEEFIGQKEEKNQQVAAGLRRYNVTVAL
jgi:hypothetical protein